MIIVYIKSLLFNGISGVPEPKDLGWLIWKQPVMGFASYYSKVISRKYFNPRL
jgi:hypothetical protein